METREPDIAERLCSFSTISDEAMDRTRELITKMRVDGFHDSRIWAQLVEDQDSLGYFIVPFDLIAIIGEMEGLLAFYTNYALQSTSAPRCEEIEPYIGTPCSPVVADDDRHTASEQWSEHLPEALEESGLEAISDIGKVVCVILDDETITIRPLMDEGGNDGNSRAIYG